MATQRSSVLAWDRFTGIPLSPVLSWQDRRVADKGIAHLRRHVFRKQVFQGEMSAPHDHAELARAFPNDLWKGRVLAAHDQGAGSSPLQAIVRCGINFLFDVLPFNQ